jgi:hypothetical protein
MPVVDEIQSPRLYEIQSPRLYEKDQLTQILLHTCPHIIMIMPETAASPSIVSI